MSLINPPRIAPELHPLMNRVCVMVLVASVLLSGCSDADESSALVQDYGNDNDEGGGNLPDVVDESIMFPADVDGDDRQGLIVTGLAGLPATQVNSPWLAMTRTFWSVSAIGLSPDPATGSMPSQSGNVAVELAVYADDFPVAAHLQYLDRPLDSCVVHQNTSWNDSEIDNPPPPSISGGQSLVINTPSGPWYSTRARLSADGQIVYESKDQLPGELPANASLSIPGSTFPTVSDYPLHAPQPVTRLQPGIEQSVDEGTLLRWVSVPHNTWVKIDWLAFDDAGDFLGFPVSCHVIDDGAFEPSVDVRTALAGMTVRLAVRYSRVYSRLDVRNGIVFYQEMEVAE